MPFMEGQPAPDKRVGACATVPDGCNNLYTDCSMRAVLDRIGDKWTVLLVGLLEAGPVRFNRLKAAIPGISQKVLTSTLRSLERDGLVIRDVQLGVPVRVEYSLTELGRSLSGPLAALRDWSTEHYCTIAESRAQYDETEDSSAQPSPQPGDGPPRTSGTDHQG